MISRLKSILLRPSLWIGIIGILAYWDDHCLHGKWVYDDAGSVAKNVVVVGQVPWFEVLTRDFWGTPMSEITSHKSFRPITTFSFFLNHKFDKDVLKNDGLNTYGYKIVNVVLHGFASSFITEVTRFVFTGPQQVNLVAQIIAGALFALHPVHAEAVSNVTSRGEMLMTIFWCLGFLSYASTVTQKKGGALISIVFVYIFPCFFMVLSLFSKEQGATLLITVVLWDFLQHFEGGAVAFFGLLFERNKLAIRFLKRTIILATQTVAVAAFRKWLNGETRPDFIFDQNPAGFSEDRFTRSFSVSWVYCLYIFDCVYPYRLGPDWSGRSIDLIEDGSDERIWAVLLLWAFAAGCVYSVFMGPPREADQWVREARRIVLQAFFPFLFAPFLLSSNLLVVVGLMKADRVIYLPILGFCIMEAMIFKIFLSTMSKTTKQAFTASPLHWVGYFLFISHIYLLTVRVHERNHAWSHSLNLWLSAYAINPRSHHTMYNCGYELSLKQRYEEAEHVLRPIGDPHVDGPTNTFVYAMVLYNLKRCDVANEYVDEAIEVIGQKRETGGPRNQPHMLDRAESNLLVARAHCAPDISQKGKILYQAVQKDQSNSYAIQQAQGLMQQVETMKKIQEAQGIVQ